MNNTNNKRQYNKLNRLTEEEKYERSRRLWGEIITKIKKKD
jgi:hypothetical protein